MGNMFSGVACALQDEKRGGDGLIILSTVVSGCVPTRGLRWEIKPQLTQLQSVLWYKWTMVLGGRRVSGKQMKRGWQTVDKTVLKLGEGSGPTVLLSLF